MMFNGEDLRNDGRFIREVDGFILDDYKWVLRWVLQEIDTIHNIGMPQILTSVPRHISQ